MLLVCAMYLKVGRIIRVGVNVELRTAVINIDLNTTAQVGVRREEVKGGGGCEMEGEMELLWGLYVVRG